MHVIGTDLVCVSAFAEQLARPGSTFESVFSAAELRLAATRSGARRAEHLAGRWAAKEALIKAWSQALYGRPPVIAEHEVDWAGIEVRADAWGRVAYQLAPQVASLIDASLNPGWRAHLSISHDGDYAIAQCLLEVPA